MSPKWHRYFFEPSWSRAELTVLLVIMIADQGFWASIGIGAVGFFLVWFLEAATRPGRP